MEKEVLMEFGNHQQKRHREGGCVNLEHIYYFASQAEAAQTNQQSILFQPVSAVSAQAGKQ